MIPINPIKTLLYATDLSEGAIYALRYAVRLAEALDGKLHVLHALRPLSEDARITLQAYVTDPRMRDAAVRNRLETAREVMAERQRTFWAETDPTKAARRDRIANIEIVEGQPAEVILQRSVSLKADMILMGSHEHGFTQTFLGTVAKRVMRRSRIPTLIIPYPDASERPNR
ncbi:universal stress protein [Paracoccus sp. Z118]|uniref:universal stress protein n=1 Tax=Paracoccus sp. Z118 TaxID=2851017 RepID=UPI001C2C3797|nr:universal stress protein [Paracoccus sp. Z118]MBV0892545.1 universal stress protein [Paracoccus sp. Z118]